MENKNYTFVVQNGKHIYTDRPMKAAIFFYFYYYFHGCSGCWLKIPKPIILLVLFVVVVRHHRLLPYIFFSFNLVFFSFPSPRIKEKKILTEGKEKKPTNPEMFFFLSGFFFFGCISFLPCCLHHKLRPNPFRQTFHFCFGMMFYIYYLWLVGNQFLFHYHICFFFIYCFFYFL